MSLHRLERDFPHPTVQFVLPPIARDGIGRYGAEGRHLPALALNQGLRRVVAGLIATAAQAATLVRRAGLGRGGAPRPSGGPCAGRAAAAR